MKRVLAYLLFALWVILASCMPFKPQSSASTGPQKAATAKPQRMAKESETPLEISKSEELAVYSALIEQMFQKAKAV